MHLLIHKYIWTPLPHFNPLFNFVVHSHEYVWELESFKTASYSSYESAVRHVNHKFWGHSPRILDNICSSWSNWRLLYYTCTVRNDSGFWQALKESKSIDDGSNYNAYYNDDEITNNEIFNEELYTFSNYIFGPLIFSICNGSRNKRLWNKCAIRVSFLTFGHFAKKRFCWSLIVNSLLSLYICKIAA